MLPHRLLTPILAALALAALPTAAHAATVTREGDVLVVRGAPGEKNVLSVGPADRAGGLLVGDVTTPDSTVCASEFFGFVTCDVPPGGVRLEAGDRDDQLNVHDDLPAGLAVTLDGGAGNDVLRGPSFTETAERLLGGDGNDTIAGGLGADDVDGGAGDDDVDGWKGPDVVRGGPGNDKLLADYWDELSTDVVDGGPGYDQISNNWVAESGNYQPPITVSVDGVADDGRPGENDNVTGVESIYLNAPATLTGSDGPDEFTVFNNDAGSTFSGRGGDDKLSGFSLADTIDGGPGNDTIDGGYGHDTLTGGPGRDTINGDVSGTTCGWVQCLSPYGNDHIDARDGEADDVTCGVGEDVVEADPVDTVAPDCETVHRGQAGGGGSSGGGGGSTGGGQGTPAVPVSLSHLRARRAGRKIVVTGRVTGAPRVAVRAVQARRTVARATVPAPAGRFRATLRAARARRVVVVAAGASRTLAVR